MRRRRCTFGDGAKGGESHTLVDHGMQLGVPFDGNDVNVCLQVVELALQHRPCIIHKVAHYLFSFPNGEEKGVRGVEEDRRSKGRQNEERAAFEVTTQLDQGFFFVVYRSSHSCQKGPQADDPFRGPQR